jgi:hypothetical protein
MRIIIAGGRDFDNYNLLKKECNNILQKLNINDSIIIISGMARGTDLLGLQFAKENNFQFECFSANWKVYGLQAGYLRNEEMANIANCLIAFWDGKSKGTKHMIDIMQKKEKLVFIIQYTTEQMINWF